MQQHDMYIYITFIATGERLDNLHTYKHLKLCVRIMCYSCICVYVYCILETIIDNIIQYLYILIYIYISRFCM